MSAPLCKDCRFAELHTTPVEKWVCSHPTSLFHPRPSLVTGRVFEGYQLDCASARAFDMDGRCGPDGKHWQAR